MPYLAEADTEVLLRGGIQAIAFIGRDAEEYLLWFMLVHGKEQYEFLGRSREWEECNRFCSETQRDPFQSNKLSEINRELRKVVMHPRNAGFEIEDGKLYPIKEQRGA